MGFLYCLEMVMDIQYSLARFAVSIIGHSEFCAWQWLRQDLLVEKLEPSEKRCCLYRSQQAAMLQT